MISLLLAVWFTAQMLVTGVGAATETEVNACTHDADVHVYTDTLNAEPIHNGQHLKSSLTVTYINPLYADVITEADLVGVPQNDSGQNYALEKSAAEAASYVTTLEEAGAILRDGMKKREETVEVSVYYDTYTEESLKADIHNISDIALGHTGQPTEGDYLRWQYGGWNCNASGVYEGDGTVCTFKYTITYYTTAEQEQEMDSAVASLLQTYDDPEEDMYTRIKTMYDYICDHVVYDYDNLEDDTYKLKYTAYAALINETAVCQGYAILLYRLALELGADARLIAGIGNGGKHGWNIVELENLYYNADSTWDAGRDPYDYFLLCDRNFVNHTRDDEYLTEEFYAEYPMGETDYVYTPGCVHTWDEGQVTKAATCTEDGKILYTCIQCNATKIEKIQSNGHNYKEEVTAPSCTEDGYTTYTCTICNDTYTDQETKALGHDWDEGVVITEPTCKEVGTKTYTCKRCDETRTDEIPEKEHTYKEEIKNPTCTEGGYTTYTCTVCGDTYTDQETKALGHDWDEGVVITEPTCKEVGTKTYTCERCNETKTEEIPAKEHTYKEEIKNPTCTEGGYTTYTCTVCGDTYTDQETKALGHDWNDGEVTRAVSCTEKGEMLYTCTRCSATKTEEIQPTGHNYKEEVTAPSCTEDGYTTHTCTVCGDSYTDSYTDAVGHDFVDGICTVCHAEEFGTYTVSGTVTAYSTKSAPDAVVEIIVYNEDDDQVGDVIVKADETTYSIELEAGTYTIQVGKQNHVTRTYTIVITDADVKLDVKICLIGDANMDGRINALDYSVIYDYVMNHIEMENDYTKKCADANQDSRINALDYSAIYDHVMNQISLW